MNCEINFFKENVSYIIRKKGNLRRWICKTIEDEGKAGGEISFIMCDDSFLSELNFRYLKHKTLTDILTFSSDDENGNLSGDIFISFPRVKENAVKFNQKTEDELHRVMIHGILHLIGYNDSSKHGKLEMTSKENFYLAMLRNEYYSAG